MINVRNVFIDRYKNIFIYLTLMLMKPQNLGYIFILAILLVLHVGYLGNIYKRKVPLVSSVQILTLLKMTYVNFMPLCF